MSEWISTKTLPPKNEVVLLFDGDEMWFGALADDGFIHYHYGNSDMIGKRFSHWMPLPQPPTAKE